MICAQAMALMSQQERTPLLAQLQFQLLETHASDWTPDQADVTLNARMDARLVPSPASPDGRSCLLHAAAFLQKGIAADMCSLQQCVRRRTPELCAPGCPGRPLRGVRAGGTAGASDRARLGPHAGAAA